MCARRRCHFHLWRSRDAVCASLATEVATTATSNPAPPLSGLGAHCDQWAAILHGKSDDARDGAPALARSHVRVPARGAIGAHAYADTCLRSRCAGDTPSNDMAITAIITGVAAVVNAAAPPLLVAAAVPAQLVLMAAFVRAVRGTRQFPEAAGSPAFCAAFRWGLHWASVRGGAGDRERFKAH